MPEFHPDTRSLLIRRGARERVRGGLPYGAVPLGYRTDREGERTRAVIDKETAPLVREAFLRMAEGKDPLCKVLEAMAGKGLLSRSEKPLGVSSFWKMLTNPFYCGMVRLKGETLRGLHEPLIDRKTFERVQVNLHRGRRNIKLALVEGNTFRGQEAIYKQ